MSLPLLPPEYAPSRADLHAVAEQVLAAARFAAAGRIALVPMPGGFGTPGFPGPGAVDRVVRVDELDGRGEVRHAPALWPQHFDMGMDAGPEGAQASYGLSPGDDGEPAPYAYVSAWQPVGDDPYWNASSFRGAVLRYDDVAAADDPGAAVLDFLRRGRTLLGR